MFKFFNINNATNNTNSNKEDGNMTAKERWMASIHKGQDLGCKAAHKTGYGLGYATTTVKEEVAYAARKVAKTRVAEEFTDGYYDGKADAYNAFADRVVKREEKAREKANAKAAEAAAQELMEEFDDSLCGDGEWN